MDDEKNISNEKTKLNEIYEQSDEGPVLYVRHAVTDYNLECLTINKELLRDKTRFIDCCLSDLGRKQAEELSEKLKYFNIKYAFCSPLLRCLETSLISLQNHPEKEKFSVIVHPCIIETVSSVQNFSKNMTIKQEKFNQNSIVKFDWSYFNLLYPTDEERETYFLNFVDRLTDEDTEAKILFEKIKKVNTNTSFDSKENNVDDEYLKKRNDDDCKNEETQYSNYERLLGKFSGYFVKKNIRPESLTGMFQRNLKFKNYLKSFLPKLSENEKIIVFTHCAFTKISTSKMAYQMEEIPEFPNDCYRTSNCEIISININYGEHS
jgi:bisphosphoglycerate-dependent phosphoglycerate mutase